MRIALRAFAALALLLSLLSPAFSNFSAAEARFISMPRPARMVHHPVRIHSRSHSPRVVRYDRSRHHHGSAVKHHGRHHRRTARVARSRHAYPLDFFMVHGPEFDRNPLSAEQSTAIRKAFDNGT